MFYFAYHDSLARIVIPSLKNFLSLSFVIVFVLLFISFSGFINDIFAECEREENPPPPTFIRGDCNSDGVVDFTDAIVNLMFQFTGEFTPNCINACDFDDNGKLEITEPLEIMSFLIYGQFTFYPPGPFECGIDPSPNVVQLPHNLDLGCCYDCES